ncbi:unnamed protein product [Dracunculus medinensis]|uniref:Secreted protein n=1 Tax=Dracunculus medinensis TaxID=318479 RepID=A0A0N4U5V1_DRAME|nr:unnamed protein product [Dracunculus medinensis]
MNCKEQYFIAPKLAVAGLMMYSQSAAWRLTVHRDSSSLQVSMDSNMDECSIAIPYCFTGSLMYLNEATLLNNCRLRYARKQIYVCSF